MQIAPFLLVMTFSLVLAQAPPTSIAGHPGWPKANPDDVKSVDAIVAATYDVISGPKGTEAATGIDSDPYSFRMAVWRPR